MKLYRYCANIGGHKNIYEKIINCNAYVVDELRQIDTTQLREKE